MTDQLSLEQKGSGMGVSLELAGRLNYRLVRKVSLFVDIGYAYQQVIKISGKSRTTAMGLSQTGRRLADERGADPNDMGTLVTEWPNNYWRRGMILFPRAILCWIFPGLS